MLDAEHVVTGVDQEVRVQAAPCGLQFREADGVGEQLQVSPLFEFLGRRHRRSLHQGALIDDGRRRSETFTSLVFADPFVRLRRRDTAAPMNPQEQADALLRYLVEQGTAWISAQRAALRPSAAPIPSAWQSGLSTYFSPQTLDAARLCLVPGLVNPPFFADLERRGIATALDFTQMDGLTYVGTVAIVNKDWDRDPAAFLRLVFRELVHVTQYRLHGLAGFMERYVVGWAQHEFDYFAIPLEREAYDLQERFAVGERFSVEDRIAQ